MKYRLIIKDGAVSDTIEAFEYYETQKDGLGEQFLIDLENTYQKISKDPQHFSFVSADKAKKMRDAKLNGFPYLVIFEIEGKAVIIYAVHNTHKKPRSFFSA